MRKPLHFRFLMFRASIVIVLVMAIFAQSMSKGIILLSYFTNKQAYERYCVNKARPQLHCDGKCQVAKKIKAEEERDQKDPLKHSLSSELPLINQHHFVNIPAVIVFSTVRKDIIPLSTGTVRNLSASLFHPPDAMA